jgi:glycosyltransferase involved in cell wall biosynthesis
VPDLLRYRRAAAAADVVHFQWLPVQAIDWALLPARRPRLITAHDVLPREAGSLPRAGQRALYARMDAVIVHSEHGAARLRDEAGVDPQKVHVIPHGVFAEFAAVEPAPLPLPRSDGPVALCFGLMRPYKGLDVLLEAWRRADVPDGAELWMVGRPRMDVEPLRTASPPGVRWLTRFVSDAELAALFRAADLAVLPYREIDQSGVLYTALAFGTPLLLSAVGGFPEVARTGAAELVPPGDPDALAQALGALLHDRARRAALADAVRRAGAPDGPYGWDAIARRTLALYVALQANTT